MKSKIAWNYMNLHENCNGKFIENYIWNYENNLHNSKLLACVEIEVECIILRVAERAIDGVSEKFSLKFCYEENYEKNSIKIYKKILKKF